MCSFIFAVNNNFIYFTGVPGRELFSLFNFLAISTTHLGMDITRKEAAVYIVDRIWKKDSG